MTERQINELTLLKKECCTKFDVLPQEWFEQHERPRHARHVFNYVAFYDLHYSVRELQQYNNQTNRTIYASLARGKEIMNYSSITKKKVSQILEKIIEKN